MWSGKQIHSCRRQLQPQKAPVGDISRYQEPFVSEALALDLYSFDLEYVLMKSKNGLSTYGLFVLKAVLVASVLMFGCMSLGELVYDENLFSGFLHRPPLWFGILVETAIATLFMTLLGTPILYRLRYFHRRSFAVAATIIWCIAGLCLVGLYSYFYWTREWHITALTPGFIFGWILPGMLFVAYLVFTSLELRSARWRQTS
ncbi:MAG: hypothetical protein EOP06_01445 [Proteobacteria bacterium]|nr:MAG: hypothetical protein EOP06_01445 [Pseudomonadota bacterium]